MGVKLRWQQWLGQGHFGNKPDGSAMNTSPSPVEVAILAFPDTTASVTFGMYDLFMAAGRDWSIALGGQAGPQLMRPYIISASTNPFTAANGVMIAPHAALEDRPDARIVCVSEISIPPSEPMNGRFDAEIAWLRRCHAQGATLATACSGALLLAEAGLLDGLDATTHWAYCDILHTRFPTVKVRRERALVLAGEGQRLVMAGGGTSWQDVVLYIIGRFVGVDAAMQVARINLIDWHIIGQQPFASLARSRQMNDAQIGRCQSWIAEHYNEPAPVAAMVQISGLAERSFKRRFQLATGMSPLEYVHTLRLEEAKQMLEVGEQPIEAVAREVGYEDAGFFNRLFRRHVNLTPAQYRKRFGAMRRALASGG